MNSDDNVHRKLKQTGLTQSRRLVLFWGGMILSCVGGFVFVRPSMNNSGIPAHIWFLAATVALAGSAWSLPKRYRIASVVVGFLCVGASMIVLRENYVYEREEARVERIRALVDRPDLAHLAIGRIAPDIEANDLSGQRMTLREYRGKVVLLVFWASSCGPCMGEVPHERAVVERFAGRPFALLGVNGDESTAKALAAVEKHSIPWKSFWNGEGGYDGPVTEQWGVLAWPTVYLLDDAGVIQQKNIRGDALDAALERMIAIAEARGHEKQNQSGHPDGGQARPNAAVKVSVPE